MPNAPAAPVCRSCVWWDTDARRATLSAPCRITTAIRRPDETCALHAPDTGPHALDLLLWRLWK